MWWKALIFTPMNELSRTAQLLDRVNRLKNITSIPRTLFAACPNSSSVIRAAIRAAKRNNAPIKFAATLNQVDMDGGYTGMTHDQFVTSIRMEAARVNFTGPVIIAVDHGGPWLRDFHRTEHWSLANTMNWVKNSFEKAIEAGFDLIHVDPTVDIELPDGALISIETVVDRTLELIQHCETFRMESELPPIAYEVGTEEVHGGLADMSVFKRFFTLLKDGLEERGLAHAWPCFVVGKVGTDLHTTQFDPETAREIVAIASRFGSAIKGHYTDNVSNPQDYPLTGIGGANVGPEFTEREYEGLLELEGIEERLYDSGMITECSGIKMALWDAVIASGRWKKWISAEESQDDFSSIPHQRQEWLIKTGCRYIWSDASVKKARQLLYENMERSAVDAEAIVLSHIENSMDKYFRNFNLVNLNGLLEDV